MAPVGHVPSEYSDARPARAGRNRTERDRLAPLPPDLAQAGRNLRSEPATPCRAGPTRGPRQELRRGLAPVTGAATGPGRHAGIPVRSRARRESCAMTSRRGRDPSLQSIGSIVPASCPAGPRAECPADVCSDARGLPRTPGQCHLGGVATTTFGVGEEFDETLLRAMADAGGGLFRSIRDTRQIVDHISGEVGELLEVTARGTVVEVTGLEEIHVDIRSPCPIETRGERTAIRLDDLEAGQAVEVILRLRFPCGQAGREIGALVSIRAADGADRGRRDSTLAIRGRPRQRHPGARPGGRSCRGAGLRRPRDDGGRRSRPGT